MKTTVVNIRHPEARYDVYIGRAGHGQGGYFGNPFPLASDTPTLRALVMKQYEQYFHQRLGTDPEFKRRVLELKGRCLGCFCHPKKCHGDVIAEYLNNQPEVV